MNKIYSFLLLLMAASLTQAQVSYTANGGGGFGGPVGQGSMSINDDGTTITYNNDQRTGRFQ